MMSNIIRDFQRRFSGLFFELDGGIRERKHEATQACIEALFDRVMNPDDPEAAEPTLDDVDSAQRILVSMIEQEAEKLRAFITAANARRGMS
jgi:hypothetical protein